MAGWAAEVGHTDDSILVAGRPIAVSAQRDPAAIDWGGLDVDIVIESTGRFRTRDDIAIHLKGGRPEGRSCPRRARAWTSPWCWGSTSPRTTRGGMTSISNASCTTNCVAPMAKVLNEASAWSAGS